MISLVYHPDERLRHAAAPVEQIDGTTATLVQQMIKLMNDERGIGLAGPQVGHMFRIFVVQVGNEEPQEFINPQIVGESLERGGYEEGCLSIPGVYAEVKRPLAITVEAVDRSGRPFRRDADGLLARVILHEYDHLEGVLFIDHLSERRRERVLRGYHPPAGGAAVEGDAPRENPPREDPPGRAPRRTGG